MSRKKAKISDFNVVLEKALSAYKDDVTKAVPVALKEAGKMAKFEVQLGSPVRTGAYRKGWDVKTEETNISARITVHNRTRYQLAHLLEKGHVLYIHGKKHGSVDAIPHIRPVQERAYEYYEDLLREAIENA